MNLYEVENGWIGESYVRCYVWAPDEATALMLATAAYQSHWQGKDDPAYAQNLRITRLFSADAAPFSTVPSGSGWTKA